MEVFLGARMTTVCQLLHCHLGFTERGHQAYQVLSCLAYGHQADGSYCLIHSVLVGECLHLQIPKSDF